MRRDFFILCVKEMKFQQRVYQKICESVEKILFIQNILKQIKKSTHINTINQTVMRK